MSTLLQLSYTTRFLLTHSPPTSVRLLPDSELLQNILESLPELKNTSPSSLMH